MTSGGGTFSPEEIKYLKSLSAVAEATAKRITYTDDFKRYCVVHYNEGASPVRMFREAGLDTALIGYKRIERCLARWRESQDEILNSGNAKAAAWKISGGVFLCFCQLLGELTCRDSGWLSWARFALPVASGVLSRVARFRLRGLVPGRGFRF